MTLTPPLSVPHPPPITARLHPPKPVEFPILHAHHHRRLLSVFADRRNLPGVARARTKDFVLRDPPRPPPVEKGKYSYEVGAVISNLNVLPPRGSIARCIQLYKNKLSMNDFAVVYREFAQRGEWQRVLRLFKYMQRQIWCKPNEQIYTIVISLLGREGLLEKCREIFESMPSHGVPWSFLSYTALINSYGRNGEYKVALELLERMKTKDKIQPNILTYNTVINSCARGGLEWEGLLGLFAEMRHEGVRPDLVTYNTLLWTCGNRGLGEEAVKIFRTMNEGGVLPDITSFTYLVETFGKLGKLEKVSELLKEMGDNGNLPDAPSFNLLLTAYANAGNIKDATGVFQQMQEMGCVPNAATFRTLLDLYGKSGKYDEVRRLFLEMKVSDTEPDAATYNVVIDVFGEGGYFKEVVTLFHDMVEENVEPDMGTYEGLMFACGKGGLHKDAEKILVHMNEKGLVPSSKACTGLIEAYGQAALYDKAIVAFNNMNEMGSKPTIETYNSLIYMFARGGLYKEFEAILLKMKESEVQRDRDSFNGIVEGYRQGGQFEEAIKAYVKMEGARIAPDERSLEAVLSVYCTAGLVDESEDQFHEIRESGLVPSVMAYCMMLAVYAKCGRWADAYKLLDDMQSYSLSSIHQIIGQMIQGDLEDGTKWQMVEYIFDKLDSEGCGLGIRFYNTLLEALWWLGQKERAARVFREATKRGLFPEVFRKSKTVWSVDVHRMWEGSAYTALCIWLQDLFEMVKNPKGLPQLASAVVVRGRMERSSSVDSFPVAKAVYSFLQDNVSPSFSYSRRNKGRITCQRSQLKRIFSEADGTKRENFLTLSNKPLPISSKRTSGYVKTGRDDSRSKTLNGTRTELSELMASMT
ncbi:Pentatricopeptide repeat-containing protein, chloroplastic [Turnera subulata]|uniref:Pentatricopeptide repeat-containing protein, chloroplastic n=1 Tax=Turnera subulata TaxID=218843 RepID=A0A9Q0GK25_9ROSI|nr:Pentatricopeptide repeat-containing protein, chloroplastic [Turnera subulata]